MFPDLRPAYFWLAGFIDGDGHVTASRSGSGYIPVIGATNRSYESLRTCQRLAGGRGSISELRDQKRSRVWAWQLTGKPAVTLALHLAPMFVEKHEAAIQLAFWPDVKRGPAHDEETLRLKTIRTAIATAVRRREVMYPCHNPA